MSYECCFRSVAFISLNLPTTRVGIWCWEDSGFWKGIDKLVHHWHWVRISNCHHVKLSMVSAKSQSAMLYRVKGDGASPFWVTRLDNFFLDHLLHLLWIELLSCSACTVRGAINWTYIARWQLNSAFLCLRCPRRLCYMFVNSGINCRNSSLWALYWPRMVISPCQFSVSLVLFFVSLVQGLPSVKESQGEVDGEQDWHSLVTADLKCTWKAHYIDCSRLLKNVVTPRQFADAFQDKVRYWVD